MWRDGIPCRSRVGVGAALSMPAEVDARPSCLTVGNAEYSHRRLVISRANTVDTAQVVSQVELGTQQTGFHDVGVDIDRPDIPVKLRNGKGEVDLHNLYSAAAGERAVEMDSGCSACSPRTAGAFLLRTPSAAGVASMKLIRSSHGRLLARLGRHSRPGTRSWLIEREMRYGGFVSGLTRHRISELDNHSLQWGRHSLMGGDRMSPRHHGYAPFYARYLAPFLASGDPVTLAEVGILRGTGLAIWSDLFPNGRIVGLDIDLSHFRGNVDRLSNMGAFEAGNHEVHEFDGFMDNRQYLADILQEDRVHVVVDDASHADESIMNTFESFRGYLADGFVYFVEDNKYVHVELEKAYSQYRVAPFGELTVITDGS